MTPTSQNRVDGWQQGCKCSKVWSVFPAGTGLGAARSTGTFVVMNGGKLLWVRSFEISERERDRDWRIDPQRGVSRPLICNVPGLRRCHARRGDPARRRCSHLHRLRRGTSDASRGRECRRLLCFVVSHVSNLTGYGLVRTVGERARQLGTQESSIDAGREGRPGEAAAAERHQRYHKARRR